MDMYSRYRTIRRKTDEMSAEHIEMSTIRSVTMKQDDENKENNSEENFNKIPSISNSVAVDIDRIIAESVDSFATIKNSIQTILERLKMSPSNKRSNPMETIGDLTSSTSTPIPTWSSEDVVSNKLMDDFGSDNNCNLPPMAKPFCNHRASVTSFHTKDKYKAIEVLMGKGQLKVAIYINSGLLTVHVKKAKKLQSRRNRTCNSFVKVEMISNNDRRQSCRTMSVNRTNSPIYDQKISFELPGDHRAERVFISIWHRDSANRKREFLGCMSFGITHIINGKEICGWYWVLTEKLGRIKHFAVDDDHEKN